ncbi:rhodanese-like domain-containing protein [Persicitalea sp.]|uniref:rhodanese-like domain-containing protein n=1 Tax=Persicitalea sp. TaxID=3100273 RepID=UPI003593EF8B
MPRKKYQDITLAQMNELRREPKAVVVDVREPWEFEEFNEGGVNIPLSKIREDRKLLEDHDPIIVICTNGTRSKVAAMDYCRVPAWAEKTIYHLKGGILEVE